MKKTEETDYNSFLLNRHLKALPTIPVSQSSKDLILSNVLRTKKKKTKNMKNVLELLKPITYVAAMIFMFLLINDNYGIIPRDSSDGFYITIESEVKGAEVYINHEHQGVTPFSKKIGQGSNIKISKDGYIEWTGEFSGNSLEEALESFESPENYRLLRGNNSLKIVAELTHIKKDTIYLETDIPGATVKINGEIVGLTPTSIKLTSTNNHIEITKDQIEKISMELLYDGEIDVVGDNLIEISRRGYNINMIMESLYYPQETHWIDENKLFIFEVNNYQYRGKVLDFDSGQLEVFNEKDLSELQIYSSNEEEVIFGQRFFLRRQETLEVGKKMYLSEGNQLIVDNNGIYVQANEKLQDFFIETSNSAKLIRAIGNMVYYQIDSLLYKYDLRTNIKELITHEIDTPITDLAKTSNGLAIVAGGEVLLLVEGEISKIPFFTDVQHITVKDQEIVIFNYEKYVTIWTYHMEKESMSKIY